MYVFVEKIVPLSENGFMQENDSSRFKKLLISRLCTVLLAMAALLSGQGRVTSAAAESTSSAKVMIGDVAPDFALTADSGQVVHLSDYRKKKRVILFFFSNVQDASCTDLCCAFRDCYRKYKAKDGEILAISPDPISDLQAFKAKHGLPYLLLSDPGNKIRKLWQVPIQHNGKSCRTTYIIDKRGKVKKIITSEGTPIEYMKEIDGIDGGWETIWYGGG